MVHGGISLWRRLLARLDLIDEYLVTLVPYVAGEGPRLFEDASKSRKLDLLSSTAFNSGLQVHYQRHTAEALRGRARVDAVDVAADRRHQRLRLPPPKLGQRADIVTADPAVPHDRRAVRNQLEVSGCGAGQGQQDCTTTPA